MARPIRSLAVLAIAVAIGLGGAPAAAAEAADFAGHYRAAVEARAEGRLAAALENLDQALALAPGNVDALLLKGLVLAALERYPDALESVEQVIALAPDYADAAIARARILAWMGRPQEALGAARALSTGDPGNPDVHALLGRLALYRGEAERAQGHFAAALAIDPDNAEAKAGMIDAEAAAEAATPAAVPALGPAWRLDTGFERSEFSRVERSPWGEGYLQITHGTDGDTQVHLRLEHGRRFAAIDDYLRLGIAHRPSRRAGGFVQLGTTPGATFYPRTTAKAGGDLRLFDGGGRIGPGIATIELGVKDYASGDIRNIDPGLQQYLLDGRLWLTGKWINTYDVKADQRLPGWSLRGDAMVIDTLRLFAGMSSAPEVDGGASVATLSRFAGVVFDVTPELAVNLAVTRDNRKHAYIRDVYSAGLSLRF